MGDYKGKYGLDRGPYDRAATNIYNLIAGEWDTSVCGGGSESIHPSFIVLIHILLRSVVVQGPHIQGESHCGSHCRHVLRFVPVERYHQSAVASSQCQRV